jgi:hypothetical protein
MHTNPFFLPFSIPTSERKIHFKDSLVFTGSCFSTEIAQCFANSGFHVMHNPFGTTFNPISIANQLIKSIDLDENIHYLKTKERFYDWESANTISRLSADELADFLTKSRNDLREKISNASFLFITFGSAFAYTLKENNLVVANCHKQPAQLFSKELLPLVELQKLWVTTIAKIKALNPSITICFTISPVRHIKDGIIENNRSKARLFELVSYLEEMENVHYFPSFEIVMDELREYRFFKVDRIHPNQEAINYIWERFGEVYFSKATLEMIAKIHSVRKAEQHVLIDSKSQESLNHLEETMRRKNELSIIEPSINW